MRVVHVITNLETGGAEMMLLKLVKARSEAVEHMVVSLRGLGTVGRQLERCGVRVVPLGLAGGRIPGPAAFGLVRVLRAVDPDTVQGWMYHGNLAAAAVQPLLKRFTALTWSIRCSFDARAHEKRLTRGVIALGRAFSRMPARTIYNSSRSMAQHVEAGYNGDKAMVVPNGFDVENFRPDRLRRAQLRARLGIESDTFVIGHVARVHPMKDHATLFQACAAVAAEVPKVAVVAVGRGMDGIGRLPGVKDFIPELGDRVRLLPEERNVAEILPAFDVFALSSAWGEGFPNVLGEAMACGVPCVATDTGDSKEIVGESGIVVAPKAPEAFAQALRTFALMAEEQRAEFGRHARRRVVEHFSIKKVVSAYEQVWASAASAPRAA